MLNRIHWLAVCVLMATTTGCPKPSPCGPSTCATGCCNSFGNCVPEPTASACGAQGAQCTSCPEGLQCQVGVCISTGSVGGGTAGAGGGSGGGSAGGGTGGSTDALSAYQAVAAAACRWQARCGTIDSAQISYCSEYYAFQGMSYLFPAPAQAEQQIRNFGLAGAQACVDTFDAAPCDSSPSCSSESAIIGGRVPTGADCLGASGECQNTLDSCVGLTCPKTCQTVPQGANGQPCRRVTTGDPCDAGLFCNQKQICEARRTDGASCSNSDQCQSGSCESSVCASLPTAGSACRSTFPRCTSGSYCGTANLCAAQKSAGTACTGFQDECVSAYACIGGSCTLRGGVGARCASFGSCQTGLTCDAVLRTCQAYEYSRPLGAPCTGYGSSCSYPQICQGARVNNDGGVGDLGTCALPQLGASCTQNYQCPQHAYCDSNKVCTTAAVGSPCSNSDHCLAADYCASTGTCAPRFATGAQCYTGGDSCLSPDERCIGSLADATPRCRTPAGAGGSCLDREGCKPLLECANQICVETGHQGKPCISGQYCLDGACRGDAGCVAPLPVGEACINYRECASGYCIDGVCRGSACP